MEAESCVPPGFRFHPTEEELVGYYLTRKINSQNIDLGVIHDVDLYRIEPWDLQERCKLGYEEQSEWYFFSHKDKKYPTGTRTNRATAAGFWKATGRDKMVLSKHKIIGMRKTLVFYKGRAPNGRKTDWIMHEYRLQRSEHEPPQEEGWVVCRAFRKQSPNQRRDTDPWDPNYFIREHSYNLGPQTLADVIADPITSVIHSSCKTDSFGYEEGFLSNNQTSSAPVFDLPQLESPPPLMSNDRLERRITMNYSSEKQQQRKEHRYDYEATQGTDWRTLHNLLAPQLTEGTMHPSSSLSSIPQLDYEMSIPSQGSGLPSSWPTTY